MAVVHKTIKRHRLIFFIVLFCVPISQFSIDIYSPSLPKIMESFQSTSYHVQQTITVFLFAIGIGQYFYGILADTYGRRIIFIIGMFLFTLSSMMCYYSHSIEILIFARFLQGLACSSIAVLSKAIAVDLYDGVDLMKASAWIGLIWGSSPILAPVIGGYIDNYGSWRLSFLILSIYGFICFLLTGFLFKETLENKIKFSPKNILKNSFIIIKNKDFICCTTIIASTNLGLFVFNLMGPFFFQNVMQKSSVFYGYMALIIGLVYLFGAFLSRFIIKYFEAKEVIRFTLLMLLVVSIFSLVFSFVFPKSITILMIISGAVAFVSGFLYPYLVSMMFASFSNMSGLVSSNYGIISFTFSSVFTLLMSFLVINSVLQIAIAYALVAVISYISMSVMFKSNSLK